MREASFHAVHLPPLRGVVRDLNVRSDSYMRATIIKSTSQPMESEKEPDDGGRNVRSEATGARARRRRGSLDGRSAAGQSIREKGIAGTLFRVSADFARSRGVKRYVTECTGHYSQTAARRNAFQERARLAYRDFRFEGQAVFAGIEPPHTHVILFEREF
jgi:hypothetical protein